MAIVHQIDGDVIIRGGLRVTASANSSLPDSIVRNNTVSSQAGDEISALKLQHAHRALWQQPNTASTDETRVIHVVHGATATIQAFKAGSIAAAVGDSTVTVDLKKNGTTCLSAPITLDSANSARVVEAGTLSVTSAIAGDVLEVVIDATEGTGTLPTGVFCYMDIFEDAD
jgi:hypothetical protein